MFRAFPIALLITAVVMTTQEPVFTPGARLVHVDKIVGNGKGPVAGLTQDDFTLLDNGDNAADLRVAAQDRTTGAAGSVRIHLSGQPGRN